MELGQTALRNVVGEFRQETGPATTPPLPTVDKNVRERITIFRIVILGIVGVLEKTTITRVPRLKLFWMLKRYKIV